MRPTEQAVLCPGVDWRLGWIRPDLVGDMRHSAVQGDGVCVDCQALLAGYLDVT